jgi:hypothetical protein
MLGIPCAKSVWTEQTNCCLVPWCWELSMNGYSWQIAYHVSKWAHLKDNSGRLVSVFCSGQHVAHTPQGSLHTTCWNVSDQTSYRPVLSLCDFHVFGFIKKVLKGCRVGLDSNLKFAVFLAAEWGVFVEGTHLLVSHWSACVGDHGDYKYF